METKSPGIAVLFTWIRQSVEMRVAAILFAASSQLVANFIVMSFVSNLRSNLRSVRASNPAEMFVQEIAVLRILQPHLVMTQSAVN